MKLLLIALLPVPSQAMTAKSEDLSPVVSRAVPGRGESAQLHLAPHE